MNLPISVGSAERSFYSVRRLKACLRNGMGKDKLTGLALLHINRDLPVNLENVILRFSETGNSKVDLQLE